MARELTPPLVVYNKPHQAITPQAGSWLMKKVKVAKAGTAINKWTFIYDRGSKNGPGLIRQTVDKFVTFMRDNMGINMNPKPDPANGVAAVFQGEQEMRAAFMTLTEKQPQFMLVVLPKKDTRYYNIVKKLADVDFGIHTVCVVEEKVLASNGQLGYFANVGLKVNLKFGGVNHLLRDESGLIKPGKTMVVGYDVTHPTNLPAGAGANETLPSMVGLVSSVDKNLGQWPAIAWNNPGGVEMLGSELNANFQSRLRLWQDKNNGSLPQNIVIFRDGVAEGQFRTVLEQELPHIRQACELMYRSSQPRISLIVSVKRHQTRFYPTDPNHMHEKSKSPKEGTVVDRGVTNVRYWDFFLQAHASLKGKQERSVNLPIYPLLPRRPPSLSGSLLTHETPRHCPTGALHGPPRRDLPRRVPRRGCQRTGEVHPRHVLPLRARNQGRQHLPACVLCRPRVHAVPRAQERVVRRHVRYRI